MIFPVMNISKPYFHMNKTELFAARAHPPGGQKEPRRMGEGVFDPFLVRALPAHLHGVTAHEGCAATREKGLTN